MSRSHSSVASALEPGTSITVAADIEPSLLALGMNNRAWFYLLGETNVDLLRDREYLGRVESEGVLTEERESKIFPETGKTDVISCMALTSDFLVWGTDMG